MNVLVASETYYRTPMAFLYLNMELLVVNNSPLNLKEAVQWHDTESKCPLLVAWAIVRMVPYQRSVWSLERNEGTTQVYISCYIQWPF